VAVLVLLVGRGSSDELHIWTDASGEYKTEAEFVGAKHRKEDGSTLVILKKPDGSTVEVPIDRLSPASKGLAVRLLRSRGITNATTERQNAAIPPLDSLRDLFGNDPLFVQSEPIERGFVMGLATANKDLLILVQGYSADRDSVLKVDRRNGVLTPVCQFPASDAAAICCDEHNLWVLSRSGASFLRRFSLTGRLMQTIPLRIPVPGKFYGLAIDEGVLYFSSTVDDASTIFACSHRTGAVAELLSTPGKVYSLALHNGSLYAYLKHFDTYSDDWLLICDAPHRALGRNKPASSRKMHFFGSPAWGLASDGERLLVLNRYGKKAEVYSVAVLEDQETIVGRPICQSVLLQMPIVNGNSNRYRMDLFWACPDSRSFQQVTNFSLTPSTARSVVDRFGNNWAHFQMVGDRAPLSAEQRFDILTTSVAHTLDRDYVFSKQDVPEPLLKQATSETYCFDFSQPAVVKLAKGIATKSTYLAEILAVRDAVNDALDVVGPSGPQCRASEFLSLGVGRCYAHTLLFAAVARARGIPTRAIGGIKLALDSAEPYEIDGDSIHTWNQCYMPGIGWVDIDAQLDDSKDGKHSHNHIGFRPNGYFITFVGAYDRRDRISTFAERSWSKTYVWSSLDKQNKAKAALGALRVTARKQGVE